MLLRKYAIKPYFTFPPHLTRVSALPDEMPKHKNRIFHSNAAILHCQTSSSRRLNLFSLVICNSYWRCCMTL